MHRRRALQITASAIAVPFAGCLGDDDESGVEEYHDDAAEYLLDVEDIPGDWESEGRREPDFDGILEDAEPDGMRSGRVIEIVSADGEDAVIGVIVFEDPDAAVDIMYQFRDNYHHTEEDIGHEAYSDYNDEAGLIDVRISNVVTRIWGPPDMELLEEISTAQIDAIEAS